MTTPRREEVVHGIEPGEDDVVPVEHDEPVDAAVMLSFGSVIPGRERLAAELFTDVGRHLGVLMDAGVLTGFRPYFFADGLFGDVSGFFLLEGQRPALDELRRDEAFTRLLLRAGGAVADVRASTLLAGSAAGRQVNLFREIRSEPDLR